MIEDIFSIIAESAPLIRNELHTRRDSSTTQNPTGDAQLAADIWADNLFEKKILELDGVGSYASEEREDVLISGEGLSVAIDPLDGSSNLLSNNMIGTIVGVYDSPLPTSGTNLIAAAYVLYGPITTMVTAHSGSVNEYAIDQGQLQPLRENITLPETPQLYGFGGIEKEWKPHFKKYADSIRNTLKLRYGGSLISDINQILTYGGVFAYPDLLSSPNGKLRILFEAHPVSYIIESAGGLSSNGDVSILDLSPTALHDRTPLYVGNKNLIEELSTFYQ
ncbi:MAG: fructose-1,6-bisphosphatase [Halobacteriales archaeon]|nr:fructose-1,6-bisphosphatase [Halobacteriales archaeon]